MENHNYNKNGKYILSDGIESKKESLEIRKIQNSTFIKNTSSIKDSLYFYENAIQENKNKQRNLFMIINQIDYYLRRIKHHTTYIFSTPKSSANSLILLTTNVKDTSKSNKGYLIRSLMYKYREVFKEEDKINPESSFWINISKLSGESKYSCYNKWLNDLSNLSLKYKNRIVLAKNNKKNENESSNNFYTEEKTDSILSLSHLKQSKENIGKIVYNNFKNGKSWMFISFQLEIHPFNLFKNYISYLNKDKRCTWTEEENKKLIAATKKYGHGNWILIAKEVGTKNPRQCLHRYNRKYQPKINKGRWSEKEDNLLLKGVEMYGTRRWNKISQIVATRSESQCRERYVNVLDPNISHERWTQKENDYLLYLISIHGDKKWSFISSIMGNRTDNQCRRQYFKLLNR
ncbi:Myb-like protein [Hamiltosporidium tvaerminnensis]|uniref:Myb-like protein n=2 Tax=Hamiltosporidium TaxID=1176354 RepID=A0A4Q9L0V0_9MICR|nr:Myb-like protein [Hamiltosporidium magnivora]TBU13581.1 Myb-like protein [Hamiltosporidium tvaerminnensis]